MNLSDNLMALLTPLEPTLPDYSSFASGLGVSDGLVSRTVWCLERPGVSNSISTSILVAKVLPGIRSYIVICLAQGQFESRYNSALYRRYYYLFHAVITVAAFFCGVRLKRKKPSQRNTQIMQKK